MKKIIIALFVSLVSSLSMAAKLELTDLLGRLAVLDQDSQQTIIGTFELYKNESITFNGYVNGKPLQCTGYASFQFSPQDLVAHVKCFKNIEGTFSINFTKSNIGNFLEGAFVDVVVVYSQRQGVGATEFLVRKTVEAKKLN